MKYKSKGLKILRKCQVYKKYSTADSREVLENFLTLKYNSLTR